MKTIYAENTGKFLPTMAKRLPAIAVVLLLGLVISACSDSRPPEQIVKERSQQRLDALLKGDVATALEFTTPAYQQMNTPGSYHARVQGAVHWITAITETVECKQDICNVVTKITYKHPRMGFENTRPLKEKWVKVDDQWWLYQH